MGFSSKQVAALRRNVEERHIRTRQSNGRELSYLEGWYVIAQANRIFGFDGWSRETLESKCVLARENRGYFTAVYTAKVRLTVQANGASVIREGHGTGEGRGESPGEVHDTALKAAGTDATKRERAMDDWKEQARKHWKEFRPKLFRALKKDGKLEAALDDAVERTSREMAELQAMGYKDYEAWEVVRESYLFVPEEGKKPAQDSPLWRPSE